VSLTPTERKIRSQIAAHMSWGNTEDRAARTANGRKAFEYKFLAEAGGDAKRAESLRRAYFAKLALKSAQARRRRRAGGADPPTPAPQSISGGTTSPSENRQAVVAERIAEMDGGGDHAA
jgi:hypothetical protein